MKNMWTIYVKDIKGFLLSPTFYFVNFLCVVLFSFLYPTYLDKFVSMSNMASFQQGIPPQQLNIHYAVFLPHLSILNLLMIILVPALNMRLLSEEKKMKTFDLLLTSPVTSMQIVVGKYFAGLSATALLGTVAIMYPLSTAYFAEFSWPLLFSAFFGLLLVGAVYTGMSLFTSALSESALVSFVMAVVLNFFVWFIGVGVEVSDSETARSILEHMSLSTHLAGFVQGNVRSSALVFLVSVVGLFCFLAERVVEAHRWR